MIQIIETSDYIKAFTPFLNGCAFRAYVESDDIKIGFGCYCLVNLKSGAEEVFVDALIANKDNPVSIKVFNNQDHFEIIKLEILKLNPSCRHCEGSVLLKPINL